MQRGIKFRNYSNREQKNLINQTLGCCRLIYNKGLAMREDAYKIGSASWSKFFDMLRYKSIWYGNEIIKVSTMYPSSQMCSCCGFKNPLVKNLTIRNWECPYCHAKYDRDINANINILNKEMQMKPA